eukprot:scaffold3454_cov68-Phaeocystis_antarctica.AAC.8
MVLTLEVSKFSGWLKASASCRAEPKGGGYDARRSVGGRTCMCSVQGKATPRGVDWSLGAGHGRSVPRTFPPCL